MSFDIQPVLFDYLSRRKTLVLPGIGSLVWTEHGAAKGEYVGEITPPGVSLELQEDIGSADPFIDFLALKYDLSNEEAKEIFAHWIEDLNGRLTSGYTITIKHIGALKNDANGKTLFEADNSVLNSAFHLPTIKLSPVEMSKAKVVTHVPPVNGNGMGTSVFINVIVPILLTAAIIILSYFLYQQLFTTGASEVSKESVDIVDKNKEDLPLTGMDTIQADPDTQTNEVLPDTSDADELNEIVMERGQEEEQLESFVEKFCIIILGSFKRSDFADALSNRISHEGLEVYTEEYNSFTRVGVRFDCYTKDLYRTLFQLRGEYGEDAWILKYK